MRDIKWPVPFCKMSGTGNDFVVIDHRTPLIPESGMATFARLVCRRRFSVGADGLFLLEPSQRADFKWRFFNADGSEAAMCGNGARCVARFASMHGMAAARMRFETGAGLVEALVAEKEVSISMTPPHSLRLNQEVEAQGRGLTVHSVDTGVPHAVVFVSQDELDALDLGTLGRALRFHPLFAPAGTNVNFAAPGDGGLRIRTYERGVEGETLACGTGAVAAALIAAARGLVMPPVRIMAPGGLLEVQFSLDGERRFAHVLLQGPAHLVYRGELHAEALIE